MTTDLDDVLDRPDALEEMLKGGADPNCGRRKDIPLLCRAARGGHLDAVRRLLAYGAEVDFREPKYLGTPLMAASFSGHLGVVQALLAAGAAPNARDSTGETALMFAAKDGHTDIARALIRAGAEVNAKDEVGDSALTWAALRGDFPEVIAFLASSGAELDPRRNDNGWTPLLVACSLGYSKTAKTLVSAGCDVNATDKSGKSAAEIAEEKCFTKLAAWLRTLARP